MFSQFQRGFCDDCRQPIIFLEGEWYHLIGYVGGHGARPHRGY